MDKRRKLKKNKYSMKVLPPEIIQPILDILGYAAAALIGWVAKWLQRKNIDNKQKKN